MKTTLLVAVLLSSFTAQAQQFSSIPSANIAVNGLEYEDGPTAKINMAEVEGIKQYAVNANNDINILLKLVSQLSDVSQIKSKLFTGIERIISQSKDSRSILLLTHSLQAGMTLVKLIDKVAVSKGPAYTPEGTIRQQVRIMKQSLKFAQDYYESDQTFINGVMVKNEVKTNPQFVEFGTRLNAFLIKLSDGLLNAQASYGMIRWSLGVLGHYIQEDKISGLNYSATLYHLANTLQGKDPSTGFSIYPDLVNLEQGEVAPTDAECILKIRDLKLLYQVSMDGIKVAKEKLEKDKLAAELKAKADEEARVAAEAAKLKAEADAKAAAEKAKADAEAKVKAEIAAKLKAEADAKAAAEKAKVDAEAKVKAEIAARLKAEADAKAVAKAAAEAKIKAEADLEKAIEKLKAEAKINAEFRDKIIHNNSILILTSKGCEGGEINTEGAIYIHGNTADYINWGKQGYDMKSKYFKIDVKNRRIIIPYSGAYGDNFAYNIVLTYQGDGKFKYDYLNDGEDVVDPRRTRCMHW